MIDSMFCLYGLKANVLDLIKLSPALRRKTFFLESVRKVSYWVTQFSEHETDGRKAYESHRHRGQVLKILGETAASIEPCEGSLDNPPAWQDFETFGRIRPLHDRDGKPGNAFASASRNFGP